MNRTTRSAILFTSALMLAGTAVVSLAAEGKFDQTHPRRAEVNHRLNNQDQRIHNEVKEGDMSKGKAERMHKEDRHIRHEERAMASRDGGHISKREQDKLNRQENKVSRQIGK
jgi:hypothetical protein